MDNNDNQEKLNINDFIDRVQDERILKRIALNNKDLNIRNKNVTVDKINVDKMIKCNNSLKMKKELDYWIPVVNKIKRARSLKFPLENYQPIIKETNNQDENQKLYISENVASDSDDSETDLKTRIEKIYRKDKKDITLKDLNTIRIFNAQKSNLISKLKMQKKIKSKSYRRLNRLDKLRSENTLLSNTTHNLDEKDYSEEKQEEEDQKRRELRMTMKYKNTAENVRMRKKMLDKERLNKLNIIKNTSLESDHESDNSSNSDDEEGKENNGDISFDKYIKKDIYMDQNKLNEKENGVYSLNFMKKAMEEKENDKRIIEQSVSLNRIQFEGRKPLLKNVLNSIKENKDSSQNKITVVQSDKTKNKEQESQEIDKKETSYKEIEIQPNITENSCNNDQDNLYGIDIDFDEEKEETNTQNNNLDTNSCSIKDIKINNNNDNILTQQQAIKMAFSVQDKENKDQEFEQEVKELNKKDNEITNKNEKLPGWGSWTGVDIKDNNSITNTVTSSIKKENKKTIIAYKLDIKNNIEELKKIKDYTVPFCPRPYDSEEQYNTLVNNQRITLNPESNTNVMYMQLNQPKIQTKMGCVIMPLKRSNN